MVEQRGERDPVQRLGLRRLAARLPGQPPVRRPERRPLRHQRTGRRDHPVQDHRRPAHRALEQKAGDRGQIRAADRRQQLQLVAEHRPRPPQRIADRRAFAHPRQIVDPGPAAPRDHRGVRPAQRGDQRARGRRPADAQIAQHHQIGPGVRLLVRDRHPGPERCLGLLGAQRVLDVDPARAAPHPVPGDVLRQLLGVAVHRHVDDPQRHTGGPRQHRRRARTVQHRPHQVPGPAGRPGRHPQLRHPVVAREHHRPRPLDAPHRHLPLRRGQPLAQFVQPPQRPRRHGQPGPPFLGVTARGAVGALDQMGEVIEVQAAHWAQITGWSARVRRG